jgi:hypothetical protein
MAYRIFFVGTRTVSRDLSMCSALEARLLDQLLYPLPLDHAMAGVFASQLKGAVTFPQLLPVWA